MISIALASYNGEKYISTQIDSILNQSYNDFELIICDDKSTDSTLDILKEYQNKDKRIKVFINEQNLGFKDNFVKCLNYCSGNFIAFCDQDDIWNEDKLERAIQLIGNNDVYCSNALLVDSLNNSKNITLLDTIFINYIPDDKKLIAKHEIHQNICQGSTMLCKRDFLLKHLPIPDSFHYHDWYFGLLASTQNGIFYDTTCTIRYRQHDNAVTGNSKNNVFIKKYLNTKYSNAEKHNNDRIEICNYIINSGIFFVYLIDYAKQCHDYYSKMNSNKDFSTFIFYVKNFSNFNWDKNKIHKILSIIKRLFGLIKYKIKKF